MVASCAYNFGQSFFEGFFPVLCSEKFGLPAHTIGAAQTAVALTVLASTALMYDRVVTSLGLVRTAVLGLSSIAGGLALLGVAPISCAGASPGVAAVAALLYALGIPLFSPSMPSLLARSAPSERRGLLLGVDSAVNTVGRILAPAIFGVVYDASPARAFGLISAVVAVGVVALLFRERSLCK